MMTGRDPDNVKEIDGDSTHCTCDLDLLWRAEACYEEIEGTYDIGSLINHHNEVWFMDIREGRISVRCTFERNFYRQIHVFIQSGPGLFHQANPQDTPVQARWRNLKERGLSNVQGWSEGRW
jgi:hypothetical protein